MPKKMPKLNFKKLKNLKLSKNETPDSGDIIHEEKLPLISKATVGKKITKKNVFEIINSQVGSDKLEVDTKTARILKKAVNKKRPKDENKDMQNIDNHIFDIINVTKYYTSGNTVTRVLKNVSVTIDSGEFVLIYGKSGGGKSTLLNLLSGLDRPNDGHLIVCNQNLPYLSDKELTLFRRHHVSFIFQNYNLLQNLTGFDNVATGLYLQKDPSKRQDINALFEQFDLVDVKDKYPAQMSGGQQQRISILRALAKNAEIIFADEPTGALDEKTSRIVLSYLFDINKELKTTIVMVTHDPNITQIADKIITVAGGKIKSVEYNKNPLHPKMLTDLG